MTLRLGDIDFKRNPVKPQLFLCKPSKQIVSKIKEGYNIVFSPKLGALNELKFSIPVFIEKHHQMDRNPNADKMRGRYLVKLVLGNYEEYFMVTQVGKTGQGDGEEYNVTTLSLGFELNDKIIRDYNVVSKTATELLNDLLVDTIWTVGYVDSEFDLKRRSLEVSTNTVLELAFEVAKTFNALVVWDTQNRVLEFRKPDLVGLNKGFKIRYGKYLESMNQEDNAEEIITRLKMYGAEDLTIRAINPTGTVYIEDFRYFMYPYEEIVHDDGSYTVVKHSDYMSDELCHHILLYTKLLDENRDAFALLIAERSTKNSIVTIKENERFDLSTALKILLDERDVLNTRIAKMNDEIDAASNTGSSTTLLISDRDSLIAQLNAKLVEIEVKVSEISAKEDELVVANDNLQKTLDKITDLKTLLALEKNFSVELLRERNQYIIEKEWQDNNIVEAEDLLAEGLIVFDEVRQPKITLNIDIVNFLDMITEQRNWDKLGLGDTIGIEHERLAVMFQAKITEIEYNFEQSSISLTISNVKDVYSNKDKFLDMLYKGYNSSTQISIDKWKWDLSMENKGAINEIINNFWDANKQAIIGAKNQVVEFSDRGLIIRDPNDPLTYLVGLNGMIAITNDGGNTWKHAITGTGIVGERIYGKVIMGVNLAIEDEHGVVKWQGSLGEIFDRNGKLVMKMGLVDENPDTFGLWSFNDITRVRMDDKTGFAIERASTDATKHPNGWEKILWADQRDGTLYGYDIVAQNIKIVNNVGDVIMDAENNYLNIGDFENIVMDNKLTTLEKMQIITELYKIEAQYKRMLEQADKYKNSDRDAVFDINAQFFNKVSANKNLYSTDALSNAYADLVVYMSQFIKVNSILPLNIDIDSPLTESTSDIPDRAEFILKFKAYYDAEKDLRNKIEDAQFYSGLNMGVFYNNVVIGEYGFIALRNDGKYRSVLNATNGLALQKWENKRWTNKVYASLGNSSYDDGTLIAEDLVAKRLRIETTNGGVLLDVNSLSLDFTVLDYIILDNVIMPPEKITLATQFGTISKQYAELKTAINKYATTIYSDRDSSYYGLDNAKTLLISAGADLDSKYNALNAYMIPVFADMNAKTDIINDLHSTRLIFHQVWEDFHKAYEVGRNTLADFLEKSSLQLGRNYNNTVIDGLNGIVVTKGDITYRTVMNATDGISIQKNMGSAQSPNWVKKFYVGLDGNLYADELQAIRLRIKSADGDMLIDGDDRKLYLNKFDIIGAGLITSEHIITNTITADNGYIADLTVNHLKTLAKDGNVGSFVDYIDIMDNKARWITGKVISKSPAKDSRGNALYWKDSEKKYLTTDATPYIAYTYDITETEKLKIAFEGSGQTSYPYSVWGAGDGVIKNTGSSYDDSARGYIYKLPTEFHFKYNASNSGDDREIKLYDNGIDILSNNKPVSIFGSKVLVSTDSGMIQLKHSSGTSLEINDTGDRITLKHSNGSQVFITNNGLTADINGNITLTATGNIKMTGARIDLN